MTVTATVMSFAKIGLTVSLLLSVNRYGTTNTKLIEVSLSTLNKGTSSFSYEK